MSNTSIRIPDKLHEELKECVYQNRLDSLNSAILEGIQMVLTHYVLIRVETNKRKGANNG